jgi:hypothetical protein
LRVGIRKWTEIRLTDTDEDDNDDHTMAVEIQTMPSLNGHANGDVDMGDAVKDGALRFTSGMILPPPEIKCEQHSMFQGEMGLIILSLL